MILNLVVLFLRTSVRLFRVNKILPTFQMGHAKRKGVFEHAQNTRIQIHPAHMQSVTRAFSLHWYILQCSIILLADSKGPDQTARPRSLIWAFAVRI